jgi:hypothetical protein
MTWFLLALALFALLLLACRRIYNLNQQVAEWMPEYPHIPEERTDFDIHQQGIRDAARAVKRAKVATFETDLERARNAWRN